MKNYRSFLLQTIEDASDIARNFFGKTTEQGKGTDNNQVLTEADLVIGKSIVEQIQKVFPSHNVIDEEAGVIDNGSQLTWVVDPIDGTSNFSNSVPTYGVMIGLLEGSAPIAGAISLPSLQEIYIAQKGKGCTMNDQSVSVSTQSELLKTLVAYGIDGHQENPSQTEEECRLLAKIILGIRNLRTSNSAFDCCMVAKGSYGAYMNRTSKIWDNVAMQIVIEEAGGTYTDFFGEPIDYTNPLQKVDQNFTACAGAPSLHGQLQKIIHS